MGLFDRLKNLFKTENYVYSAKELSSNTVKESKTFVPFGSLLKDTSGTFPRREKPETKETESKEKTKASLFTRIFSRFRNKPLSEETIEQIQQLMEKNPAAAKVFFGIFDVKELKSIESYLDKNSELGGQWLEFRDAATEVLKSKETDKKMQDDLGRIARAYGVEPRALELKQIVEGEKRKREKGEFGKENLDEKAMESSAKMFEKAEEAAKREMVLRQYPQTADFFRVVEGEDENKLFSPNKSLLPKISEAEIKKVSDIGMRETATSGILSRVVHVLRGATPREEERKEKEGALQQLADKLTLQLVDFWGIPNIKPFSVRVQIFDIGKDKKTRESLPWAGAVDKNGVHFILVNQDYLNEEFRSGLINIKSVLAEEVCHYLEDDVKSMYGKFTEDRYVSEFFGIISRFCISEQNPEMFHEDYRKYLHQAASFSIEKKQYEDALKKLAEDKRKIQSDMTEGRLTNPEELKRIEDEEKEIKDDLNHLSYYPGAAYYYEVKAMSQQQRFELLMESPQQIRNSIIEGKKLIEKLSSIGPKVYDRESRKFTDAVMTKFGLEQSPGTASFFQKVAEGAGKEEYGRGAKSLQEVSMELSDVKSAEEIPLQQFVRNISIDLAGWWDIPIEKIEGKIPKVQIISYKQLGDGVASYSWSHNIIYISDKLLEGRSFESLERAKKNRFSIEDVKGVLAEEVGHFVTDFAYYEIVGMKMDPFVAEFFGLTSSLHIAEQIPQMFKEDYRSYLKEATKFSESEKIINDSINLKKEQLKTSSLKLSYLENSGKNLGDPNFRATLDELINVRKEIENLQSMLDHLSYYPAVAFYYEIRKMSPTDRYRLITLPEKVFRRDLIKPVQENLDSLKQILAERFEKKYPTLLYGVYSKALPQFPEGSPEPEGMKAVKAEFIGEANKGLEGSSGFFQRAASEAGKAEYGRITVKEEVEEQSALGAGALAGTLKGLENVGGFFQRAASEIGKAAYGRVAEAVAAKLEQQPAAEAGEEYPQEEQPLEEYQETGEAQVENEQFEQEPSEPEEYPEAEQNLEEQTQGEYDQPEEVQEEQYGPESEQASQQPQINIEIPDKVTKKVAKKLESMGIKLPKKMIKK